MPEITIRENDVVVIIGVRGSGKSTLSKFLLVDLKEGRRSLVYDTMHEYDTKISPLYRPAKASLKDHEKIAKKVYQTGNMLYVVEEFNRVCTPSSIGDDFERLCTLGRHRNVGMILIARRIAGVHKTPCSQADHWFIFRTFLPNDIQYLKEFIGNNVDQLATLPDYHFMHWHRGQATIYPPIPLGDSK